MITPPDTSGKNACLPNKKINGKFVVFHRLYKCIYTNMTDDLNFDENKCLVHNTSMIRPGKKYWDISKFEMYTQSIATEYGWLLIYHRSPMTTPNINKVEAALLALDVPSVVISETDATLLEPEMDFGAIGFVPSVAFPSGLDLLNDTICLYYGGAGKVVAVAVMVLKKIYGRSGICPGDISVKRINRKISNN